MMTSLIMLFFLFGKTMLCARFISIFREYNEQNLFILDQQAFFRIYNIIRNWSLLKYYSTQSSVLKVEYSKELDLSIKLFLKFGSFGNKYVFIWYSLTQLYSAIQSRRTLSLSVSDDSKLPKGGKLHVNKLFTVQVEIVMPF